MIKPILNKLFWGGFRHLLSDKQYGRIRYWLELGRWPNLKNPQSFSEKIQHIKLYQRTDLRQRIADRSRVRTYVAEKIGEKHLIPLIAHVDEITEKVWKSLPNQFVLKANHGCGMVKIVQDKSSRNADEIQRLSQKWQEFDYYNFGREWVYKTIPRTIIIEDLLKTSGGKIPEDYKFFCFDGKVEVIQIDFDRFGDHTRNLYDRDFNLLTAKLLYPNKPQPVKRPPLLYKAIEIAETLSADFDFIRVDLFLVDHHIYFGELTNYPGNGFAEFEPYSFDKELGKKWNLVSQK